MPSPRLTELLETVPNIRPTKQELAALLTWCLRTWALYYGSDSLGRELTRLWKDAKRS